MLLHFTPIIRFAFAPAAAAAAATCGNGWAAGMRASRQPCGRPSSAGPRYGTADPVGRPGGDGGARVRACRSRAQNPRRQWWMAHLSDLHQSNSVEWTWRMIPFFIVSADLWRQRRTRSVAWCGPEMHRTNERASEPLLTATIHTSTRYTLSARPDVTHL